MRKLEWRGAEAIVRRAVNAAGDHGVLQCELKNHLVKYSNRSQAASRAVQTLMRWGVVRREPEGASFRVWRIKKC